MKIRKDLVITVLVTFCLTATFFMTRASWSGGEWDPWVDIKEDGTVDIYDAITLANAYGTSGDTTKNVTVTNWQPPYKVVNVVKDLNITWSSTLGDSYSEDIDVGTFEAAGYSRMRVYFQITNQTNPIGSGNFASVTIRTFSVFDLFESFNVGQNHESSNWYGGPTTYPAIHACSGIWEIMAPRIRLTAMAHSYMAEGSRYPSVMSCLVSVGVYLRNE